MMAAVSAKSRTPGIGSIMPGGACTPDCRFTSRTPRTRLRGAKASGAMLRMRSVAAAAGSVARAAPAQATPTRSPVLGSMAAWRAASAGSAAR